MAVTKKLPPGVRLTRAGQYQIRYTGPDGRRYSGGTYRTKTDATKALALIQASISDRTWKARKASVDGELSGKHSLSEWSEEWIRIRSSKTGRPLATRTVAEYRRLVASSLSRFDSRPVESITSGQVRKWWAEYRVQAPRAANSAYKYLSSVLAYAVKRGALYETPCDIEGATHYQPAPKPKLSSQDQIDKLITETSDPWKTFFTIAVYGGLRRGEIAELRVGDIARDPESPDRLSLEVSRSVKWLSNSDTEVGPPKSATGARLVPLGLKPSQVVAEYLDTRPGRADALLFSRDSEGREHLRESRIRNEMKRARDRFGISESLHRLRDYSLTRYAQAGATLQEVMARGGHNNVRAAMAYQRDAGRAAELADRMG